jgi:hypothetical protein
MCLGVKGTVIRLFFYFYLKGSGDDKTHERCAQYRNYCVLGQLMMTYQL